MVDISISHNIAMLKKKKNSTRISFRFQMPHRIERERERERVSEMGKIEKKYKIDKN
jgi:hypothetical protein